jgi:hypothetical protein
MVRVGGRFCSLGASSPSKRVVGERWATANRGCNPTLVIHWVGHCRSPTPPTLLVMTSPQIGPKLLQFVPGNKVRFACLPTPAAPAAATAAGPAPPRPATRLPVHTPFPTIPCPLYLSLTTQIPCIPP